MAINVKTERPSVVQRFDHPMFEAALAYLGLPKNYSHVFKTRVKVDKATGLPMTKPDGTEITELISCSPAQAAKEGHAIWIQVNKSRKDAEMLTFPAKDGRPARQFPRRAKNEEIGTLQNITLDFEYPPQPQLAHQVGRRLVDYLIEQGLAAESQPIDDSGGGAHIELPLPAIVITNGEDAKRWNNAIALLVHERIQPEFLKICEQVGVVINLEGFDISRVLSLPGTWRPYNPKKGDCEQLQQGYLRRWLAPYVDGRYPVRVESQVLRDALQACYERCAAEPKPERQAQRPVDQTTAYEWLCRNAGNYYQKDRSIWFHALVTAVYLKWGSQAVRDLAHDIDRLSGGKYGDRVGEEVERSLDKAEKIERNDLIPLRTSAPDSAPSLSPVEAQTARVALDKAIAEKDIAAIYHQADLLAQLPYDDYATYKQLIKAACPKINLNDLEKLVNAARPIKVRDTRTAYEKTTAGMIYYPTGSEALEISNFAAEILADVKTDDGAECTRSYTIQATLAGRAYTFDVLAKEFAGCGWVDEHIGARAQVTAGQSMKAHLVNAIKTCSDPREELHYSHTGWRKIAGTMGYLYAGGVVSQVSQAEKENKKDLTQLCLFNNTTLQAALQPSFLEISQVSQLSQEIDKASVRLAGPLSKYVLAKNQGDLQRAIRASLRFTDLASDSVTMPLYAANVRAPLGDINFGVHLAGQSGMGKSELAALLQQHYGAAMTAEKLPGSWESTENSLEMLLFQAKDALVVIDDFKPKGPKSDQDRLHAKADRIFRQIGNGAARGRLNSDLEQRAERRPRCLLLSTGEDIPRGQSLKARGVILLLEECLTSGTAAKKLAEAQRDARSGLYAQAMAGYIEWLAPRIDRLQDCLADLVADERDSLNIEGHARTNSNTAQMLLGFKCFLQFACEAGALTISEAQDYLSRCMAALLQVASEAARENSQEKPSEQWRRLVLNAILSKKAHLVTVDGKNPGQQFGWTKSVRLVERDGETVEDETVMGGGSQIGWIDEDSIYLLPAAAYRVARELGSATGDEITTLEPTLRKFLLQDKMLASTDRDKARKTITVRRRVGPKGEQIQVDVLHFKRGVFYPSIPPIDSSDTLDLLDSEASESASDADSEVSQVPDTKTSESSHVPDSEQQLDSGQESADEKRLKCLTDRECKIPTPPTPGPAQKLLDEIYRHGCDLRIREDDSWGIAVPDTWSERRYEALRARVVALDSELRQILTRRDA